MDGRLALSRRRQNGRVADQTLPLTERLLSRLPGPRAAWVLAWAAIPVVAGLLPSAYLATVGTRPLPVRLLIGLVFAYDNNPLLPKATLDAALRLLAPIFTQRIGPRSAAGDPPHIPSLATDRTLAGRWVHDTVADCWVRQAVTMR
jgi:hypothetical protein